VAQVRHGVHAQPHVVQALIREAVAGAAAHVRSKHRVSSAHQVLQDRIERRPQLALRSAVHVDDDGEGALLLPGRRKEKGRDLAPVEGRIMHELWYDKVLARDTARRALRRLPQHALVRVPDPHIGVGIGRFVGERQACAVARPGHLMHHTRGQFWDRQWLALAPAARDVEERQARIALDIGQQRQARAVVAERDLFIVPLIVGKVGHLAGGDIEPGKREKLAPTVAEQKAAAAVRRPLRRQMMRRTVRRLGREPLGRPAVEVEQEERVARVAFDAAEEQPATIGRVVEGPIGAVVLVDQPW
jgi:hypothetical protein